MRGESRAPDAPERHTLRPASATIALIVAGVAAVVLLGDAALRAGLVEMLRLAPWVLLAVWLVFVGMYASHLSYDREGVTVQNYLRRTRIPWSQVADVTLRWQVVFTLVGGGAVSAHGGPVAGRPGRAAARATRPEAAVPAALRDLGRLRDAWQDAAADAGGGADGTVRRSWDVPLLLALAVIVVWASAALLTIGG